MAAFSRVHIANSTNKLPCPVCEAGQEAECTQCSGARFIEDADLATCPECGGEGFVEARPAIVGDHEVWPTTPYHPCFVCDDGLVPAGEVGR